MLATPSLVVAEKSSSGSTPRPPITLQKGYCIAPQTGSTQEHFDNNLKNIGWNDKISSITWILVTDYRQFIDDNPDAEHPDC